MSWFRSNRGRVTWVALFALACQLAFSFGHLHLGKVSFTPIAVAVYAAVVVNTGENSPAPPPPPNDSTTGGDFCALCANINLAASLAVPTAPVIVPPFSSDVSQTWSPAGLDPVVFDHVFFDARGPPYA